jgi:hypothetical protein
MPTAILVVHTNRGFNPPIAFLSTITVPRGSKKALCRMRFT